MRNYQIAQKTDAQNGARGGMCKGTSTVCNTPIGPDAAHVNRNVVLSLEAASRGVVRVRWSRVLRCRWRPHDIHETVHRLCQL
jgi:hypothetical protein